MSKVHRPTHLTPMPLSEVINLKVGDHFFGWWAKDGNPSDVRLNEIVTILEIEKIGQRTEITLGDYSSFSISEQDLKVPQSNFVDWSGRGPLYFYYP